MAGQGTELRREIRPEGECESRGRGEDSGGWLRLGLAGRFLTDATLAAELIHMGSRKGGGHIQRAFSFWVSLHSYKVLPLGLSP